jgi:hypothetical protein
MIRVRVFAREDAEPWAETCTLLLDGLPADGDHILLSANSWVPERWRGVEVYVARRLFVDGGGVVVYCARTVQPIGVGL